MSEPISSGDRIAAAAAAARAAASAAAAGERSHPAKAREERSEPVEVAEAPVMDAAAAYRVKLDPDTLRVITEVINPGNGEVMFYLPPGYRPSVDVSPPADGEGPAGGAGQ